jgi:BirA family biotin operon repressor/biotin-[acetyl-CoA-carboxylase] ligase
VTPTLPAGYRLVDMETVASTNDEALRLAGEGAPEGVMVRARRQTAGRGRRGRAFVSPPGNLYLSLILRPEGTPAHAALVGFAVSLAIAEAIDQTAPEVPGAACKWPNDVLVDGRKVGAVLIEASSSKGAVEALVVGIGVNLVSHPELADYPAGDLADLGAPGITPDRFLEALAERLDHWLGVWRKHGMAGLRAPWLARAAGLGHMIVVRLEQESFDGRFLDLDTDGALVLDTPDGARRKVTAGAVFFPEAA